MESQVTRLNRRQFIIRLGATSATITLVGAGVSALLNGGQPQQVEPLPEPPRSANPAADATAEAVAQGGAPQPPPNADDPVHPAPGTRAEFTPVEDHYRIDIAAVPPVLDEATWRLPITGLVDNPMEFTLDDLKTLFTPVNQYITMECISNRVGGDLISTQYWTGASFRDVLAMVEPQANATHVYIEAADGFDETVSLELINSDPQITLNYYWDGQPLPTRNGFPIRTHIPNRFGMKQPKWITHMELVEGDQDGYWVRRGWSKDAIIRATSVIDTVVPSPDDPQLVSIGGIAFAGPRGISQVEVKVDSGDWNTALLRAPLNNDLDAYKTWRIWRYDWPYTAGTHRFTVRMREADGTAQIEDVNDVRPDGATGLYATDASV